MTGYPWSVGDALLADDLNAAIASAVAGGPFLPLSGGTVSGDTNFWPPGNGQFGIGINHNYATVSRTAFLTNINTAGTITDGATAQTIVTSMIDNVDATGAQGGGLSNIRYGISVAAGAKGGRTAFGAHLTQTGATSIAPGQYYVAGAFYADAAFSAGGTAGAGNARGDLFASNDSALLKAGSGLYWNFLVGYELDIGAEAGTGVGYKQGMKIVTWASDRVAGSGAADAAYGITAQGTSAGWDVGYCIGSPEGWWPMKATGTLIGTLPALAGGPAYAAAHGVDFSAVTFSADAFKSNGFSVGPSGRITVRLDNAANDAAAASAGVPIGALYRNAGAVMVRLV